ncbi:hypothetical protein [Piscibacillus salipiscarius]|uniref:Uncharacterized protein n=1 Tax=Piscibacillus salipiscarius TaxID=299480 RepID=A0ABW5QDW5_9BACI
MNNKLINFIYLGVVTFLYIAYIYIDIKHFYHSKQLITKEKLSSKEIEHINQIGTLLTSISNLISVAFITVLIIGLKFVSSKHNFLNHFLKVNIIYLVTVIMAGLMINSLTSLPIGNSMQFAFIPLSLVLGLAGYMIIKKLFSFKKSSINPS